MYYLSSLKHSNFNLKHNICSNLDSLIFSSRIKYLWRNTWENIFKSKRLLNMLNKTRNYSVELSNWRELSSLSISNKSWIYYRKKWSSLTTWSLNSSVLNSLKGLKKCSIFTLLQEKAFNISIRHMIWFPVIINGYRMI